MSVALPALLVLVTLVPLFLGRASPDVSWLLYAAERVLAGDRLYLDVVETNPPLIVWLNLAPAWIARALGVRSDLVYNGMVAALALGSVVACRRLLVSVLPDRVGLQRRLTLVLVFALFPLVRADFGQREHLALILMLPLGLLAAVRIRGARIPAGPAIGIGVAAAVGIALKPYFVLPWLGLEACVRLLGGGRRLRLHPETVAIGLTGLGYLALVLLLAPEYRTLAPLIAGTYYDYRRNPLAVTALVGEGAAPTAAALLIALLLRRHAGHPALWAAIGTLAAGFYAAAVAQHKGWEYHFYPAFASGVLLLGVAALDLRRPLGSLARRAAAAAALAAAVTVAAVTLAGSVVRAASPRAPRYQPDPDLPELIPLVRERAGQGPVMVLSWIAVSAFPLLPEAGAQAGMRFNFLWMLGGLYGAAAAAPEPLRYHSPAEMPPVERYLIGAVAEDLSARRPALVLVLVPAPDQPEWGLRRIDLLDYFQRDPRFAQGFTRYRHLRTVGQYWVFERLPEDAPPAPPRGRQSRWEPAEVEAVLAAEQARRLDLSAVVTIFLFALAFGVAWRREAPAHPEVV